ncbi:MAG TPA: hypothetical protein VI077_03455, partial [Pseudolabrys sp.]
PLRGVLPGKTGMKELADTLATRRAAAFNRAKAAMDSPRFHSGQQSCPPVEPGLRSCEHCHSAPGVREPALERREALNKSGKRILTK